MSEIAALSAASRPLAGGMHALLTLLSRRFRRWRMHRRTRRRLFDLDENQLRDIGLSRREALREARRSFPFHGDDRPAWRGGWL